MLHNILRTILILAAVSLGEIILGILIMCGSPLDECPDWLARLTGICICVFIIGIVAGLIALIIRYV